MPGRRKLVDLEKLVDILFQVVSEAKDFSEASDADDQPDDDGRINERSEGDDARVLNFIKYQYKIRRFREKIFDQAIFSEPSWDILLELFRAHLEGESLSTKSVCFAACVPPTTALRYIDLLEIHDLIKRIRGKSDHRITYIILSDKGKSLMKRYYELVNCNLKPFFNPQSIIQ